MSDELLSLAVSMQSNKGVYALLLGSGVSRSAGVPTGWEIVEDLIKKMARAKGTKCGSNPAAWYEKQFKEPAEYTKIIDQLAKSPAERSQLLRRYFEPNEDERPRGLKQPTLAHKAIAHLMAEGYVRVILTTNFDRLLESALEAEGVKATILSTPDSIDGALPLVHTRRCVLKLHGDYQDTRIMNTSGEVSTYDGRTNKLLDQILDEFGLIVCGWSADWDEALRSAIKRCQSRRFTTYWTTLGNLTKAASQLVELRRSRVIEINSADSFFAELSEKVNSLADLSRQRPLDDALEVAALKRYLTEPKYRIELRDLLTAEREKLHKQLFSDQFRAQGVQPTADAVVERVAMYESATERMRDLLITGCYYGESQHLPLWVECLERTVTFPGPEAGFDTWTTLRRYPALLLLYAGGVAATAANNHETLLGLLTRPKFRIGNREMMFIERVNCLAVLDRRFVYALPGIKGPTAMSRYVESLLQAPLADFVPDENLYQRTFDRFEYVLAMVYMNQVHSAWAPPGCFAWRYERDESSPRELIDREISELGENWPLLKAGFCGGSLPHLREVKSNLDQFIARMPPRVMW